MVKRWDASGLLEVEECKTGDFVLHSDYAALQASHARLLEALTSCAETLGGRCLWPAKLAANVDSAIAAAQPFTET